MDKEKIKGVNKMTMYNLEYAKKKRKRNKRNKHGYLKGHRTYFDKEKGICFITEKGRSK